MKKPKLLGIGNEREFNYVIITKENNFFDWFISFIEHFIRNDNSNIRKIKYKDTNIGSIENIKKDIKNYNDKHESYNLKNLRIDIFYGDKKIFITFYTSLENKRILMDKLNKMVIK